MELTLTVSQLAELQRLKSHYPKREIKMHVYCDRKNCVNNGWSLVSGYHCCIRKRSIQIDKSGKCSDSAINPNYKPLFKGDK
jgi:hypothetical protein